MSAPAAAPAQAKLEAIDLIATERAVDGMDEKLKSWAAMALGKLAKEQAPSNEFDLLANEVDGRRRAIATLRELIRREWERL